MRAIVHDQYGPPDGLNLQEVETPAAEDDEVLVRVHSASVNPMDWHYVRGIPYVMRLQTGLRNPTTAIRGNDLAGRVEAVGPDVETLQPGDEVFGGTNGTFAEYVASREGNLAKKPATLSFEEAAAVPTAGVTALQGVHDVGELQAGQSVLINGASGGVGTFAVQLARSSGARVTGVCSSRNVELVQSLGARDVIDYTDTDFTRLAERYDLVVDLVGNRSLRELRRVLEPEGTLVLSGGAGGVWLGPLGSTAIAVVASRFVSHEYRPFLARLNSTDLGELGALIDAGEVTPIIDRTYPLEEVPSAIEYVETGHARGKVPITI